MMSRVTSCFSVTGKHKKFIRNLILTILTFCFSLCSWSALAVEFNVPATDADGNFTISWTGARTLAQLYEVGGSADYIYISGVTGSYNVVGKSKGTYTYRLRECLVYGGSRGHYYDCTDYQKSIVVGTASPTISAISNLRIDENTSSGAIPFTIADKDTSAGSLRVTATSSNPALVPTANILLAGNTTTRSVTINPAANKFGSSTITITVSDGTSSASTSFVVTVNNLPATLSVDANNGKGNYTLSWKNATNTARLFEKRNSEPEVDVFGGDNSPSGSKSFKKTDNGTYTYRLQDCTYVASGQQANAQCTNTDSKTIVVKLPIPAIPTLTLSSTSSPSGSYLVSWSDVEYAKRYELLENNVAVANGGNALFKSKAYSSRATGVYSYQIRACNESGCGSYSPLQTVKVARPPNIGVVTATMDATSGVATLWGTVPYAATQYEARVQKGAGDWGAIAVASSNPIKMAPVTSAGSYTHQVRACDVAGDFKSCSAWVTSNVVSIAVPAVPALEVPPNNTTGSYSVSWAATANTISYVLNENGMDRPSTTATAYGPVTKANGSYKYRVKACNAAGCSAYSPVASIDVAKIGTMGAVSANLNQSNGVTTLTWTSVSDATLYTIQPVINGANHGAVVKVSNNSASLSPVTVAGNYTYRVSACAVIGSNTNCSSPVTSNTVTPLVPSTAPVVTAPLNSRTGEFMVKWNSVKNATKYELYENNTKISTVAAQSLTFSNADARPTGNYAYKVRACVVLCGPFSSLANVHVVRSGSSSSTSGSTGTSVLNQPAIDPLNDYVIEEGYWGALSGTQSVSVDGSFNYVLPIVVPVGINDVQPKLSLSYNSNSNNGLLGWGWSLDGLSAIKRCAASVVRDDYVAGIQAGDNYRYCLDDQRLVEIGNGEFRTERESFLHIQKKNNYWLITNAKGTTSRYGYNVDSYQSDDKSQPFIWYLDEQKDVFGNSWSVTYSKNSVSGTHYPEKIDYTENPRVSAKHQIIFHYENREDISVKMMAGRKIKVDKRLVQIAVKSNGKTVKTYSLDYQKSGQTYHGKPYSDPARTSRLAKITLCYSDNSKCAKPVEFNWNLQSTQNYLFTLSGSEPYPLTSGSPKLLLDINGDGILEPYYVNDSSEVVTRTNSKGRTYTVKPSYRKADVNRDGFDDVIKEFKTVNGISVYLSDGTNISSTPSPGYTIADADISYYASLTSGAINPYAPASSENGTGPRKFGYATDYADVNGDGLLDLVRYPAYCYGINTWCVFDGAPSDISVAINSGSGFGPFVEWYGDWSGPDPRCGSSDRYCRMTNYKLSFIDLDGDGLKDFLATTLFPSGEQSIIAGYNKKSGAAPGRFEPIYLGWQNAKSGFFGDFNGDGITDIAALPMKATTEGAAPINEEISVSLGVGKDVDIGGKMRGFYAPHIALTGHSFTPFCGNLRSPNTTTQEENCQRVVIDFNNDGLDDILEWGGRINKQCLDVPIPTDLRKCLNFKRTYVAYQANVYLSLGGSNDGGVSFSPPIAFKNLETLRSIKVADIVAGMNKGAKTGFDDYNNDGTIEDDSRLKNNVLSNRLEMVIEANRNIQVDYKALASDEIYQSVPDQNDQMFDDDGAAFDNGIVYLTKVTGRKFGVKELRISNGAGGVNKTRYTFKGSKTHSAGYGDLGFKTIEKIEMIDGETPIKTVSHYYQVANPQYKLAGHLKQQLVYVSNAEGDELQQLSDTRYQWKVRIYKDDVDSPYKSPHYFPYLYESSREAWDLDGTKISNSLTKNHTSATASCAVLGEAPAIQTTLAGSSTDVDYNSDGILLYSETATCDTSGSSAAVQIQAVENLSVHSVNHARGLVGKRKQFAWVGSDIALASKGAYAVRTQGFTYNELGQLSTKITEPDGSDNALKLVSAYRYNDFGSVSELTESWGKTANDGLAINSRVTSFVESYDALGVRKLVVTKPLNLVETTEFHPVWGKPTKYTDVNGLITVTEYDDLGREVTRTHADQTTTHIEYRECANSFSYNTQCAWYAQTKTTGSSAVRAYYDGFNRMIGSRSSGLDGRPIYSVQTYNARGSVHQNTAPFYYGEAQQTVTYGYDATGRMITTKHPDGSSETQSYAGLIHTRTNRLGQTQIRYLNAAGRVMKSIDNTGTPVMFSYWPFGELRSTQVNNDPSTLVNIVYDTLGRKIEMTDPNTGSVNYTYNALGLITTQTDAKNQRTCYSYDALERQVQRVDNADATCRGSAVQTWTYDTQPYGKGQLATLAGKNTDGSTYRESYRYTPFGLLQTTTFNVEAVSYDMSHHYDEYNRLQGVTYPTGYIAANRYNEYGHLEQVLDSTGTTLWTANSADARGKLTQFTLGNGVVTDQTYRVETGRIETIRAVKGGLTIQDHVYQFDNIGNLTSRQDLKNGITQSFCYDGLNRLKGARFDGCSAATNDYRYDPLGNLVTKTDAGDSTVILNYDGQGQNINSAGPHAVTAADDWSYQYDAVGNLVQAAKADGTVRTVQYSAFNTPTSITQGNKFSTLVYGPNKQRIKQSDSNGRVTRYIGGIYEEVIQGGVTKKIHYIGDFALFVQKGDLTFTNTHEYLHRDHIGSVVAITGTTLESANDVQWQANGAWGERRFQQWDGLRDPEFIPTGIARGFTNHEHLDSVGLIHMNGRVYDPELGRFMSADPFVQAPHNTQSYNRYSYVFNNPLSFTDPNGYQARTVEDIHVPGKDTREDQRRQREQEREDGNQYSAEEMARQYIEQMIAYSMSEWTFSTPDGIVRISITDPVKAVAGISGGEHAQEGLKPTGAEYQMVADGKLAEMWQGRCAAGDPIGCVGFATWGNAKDVLSVHGAVKGAYWLAVGESVRTNAKYGLLTGNPELMLSPRSLNAATLSFGKAIARAHLDATSADLSGRLYFLSAPEITAYHHQVFDEFNVSRRWYGGSYGTGVHEPIFEAVYCRPSCDRY